MTSIIFWFHLGQLSFDRQRLENFESLARVENMPLEMVKTETGSTVPTRVPKAVEDPPEVD
jgi:hypothetical protein